MAERRTNFGNISCDNGDLGENVEDVVKPSWEKGSTRLCKIEPSYGTQPDAKSLEENSKQI